MAHLNTGNLQPKGHPGHCARTVPGKRISTKMVGTKNVPSISLKLNYTILHQARSRYCSNMILNFE